MLVGVLVAVAVGGTGVGVRVAVAVAVAVGGTGVLVGVRVAVAVAVGGIAEGVLVGWPALTLPPPKLSNSVPLAENM